MLSSSSTSFICLFVILLVVLNTHSSTHHVHAFKNDAPSTTNTKSILLRKQQRYLQQEEEDTTSVTLSGFIYSDLNSNGIHDPNEPGIPSITVQIRTCQDERQGATSTNSQGEFSVTKSAGCYYAKVDVLNYLFSSLDVNPISGKTNDVNLVDGESYSWTLGIIPEEGTIEEDEEEEVSGDNTNNGGSSEVITTPFEQVTTPSPITSSPTTQAPTPSPTLNPITSSPTTQSPTVSPTISTAPSECIKTNVNEENIMSSAPIVRASYGMIFSVSTPPQPEDDLPWDEDSEEGDMLPNNKNETIQIKSISLRTLSSIMSISTATNYQVYYRYGDYVNEETNLDTRGDLEGWILVANASSIGERVAVNTTYDEVTGQDMTLYEIIQEPLIPDSSFVSSVTPSDINKYEDTSDSSTKLSDNGMEVINYKGDTVKTYLYQIPTSNFSPISIPKYNGKISFYITLNRALLQYGEVEDDEEWDTIDVENLNYDSNSMNNDMNVRIHVGEGVTSYPWTTVPALYTPRRFLGKVWYEQTKDVPCSMHESAPSESPSVYQLPPLPGQADDINGGGVVGEAIDTRFVVSIFLQQDINEARKMGINAVNEFKKTMLEFLNEEYILSDCIWGIDLDVVYQLLSRLDGVGRRQRWLRSGRQYRQDDDLLKRTLQSKDDITILQVEMLVKGVAFDDEGVCPLGATPASPTSNGNNWKETMANIGIDTITTNSEDLGERLKEAHPYFASIFAVAADPTLISRSDDEAAAAAAAADNEDGGFPLIPIIGAVVGVVVVLLLAGFFVYRRRKQQKQIQEGNEEGGIPKDLLISMGKESEIEVGTKNSTLDPLSKLSPTHAVQPQLDEIVAMRGLPRRRSEPALITLLDSQPGLRRTRSLGCMRDVWINLNKPAFYGDKELAGGLMVQLIDGTLYPVDDSDILLFEREKAIVAEDPDAPYVPCAGNIEHNFIDENEYEYVEKVTENDLTLGDFFPEEKVKEEAEKAAAKAAEEEAERAKSEKLKVNPLVMQQVEMLEAKWKQLKDEYGSDDDSNSDEENLDDFDVNARIEQLMNHIEELEDERKNKLAELKKQEEEEEELARKRMVRGGQGINYNEDLNQGLTLRKKKKKKEKKKKKKKTKTVTEDLELDDFSSDEESSEEEDEENNEDFDIKWMRLKVPLAAQNPEAMRRLVEQGRAME